MIRNTHNESQIDNGKLSGSQIGRGETIESVDSIFGLIERRDIDARSEGQTQTPSNRHTGNAILFWQFGNGQTIQFGNNIPIQI